MIKHFITILYILFLTLNVVYCTNVSEKEETKNENLSNAKYGEGSNVKVVKELNGNFVEKETILKDEVSLFLPWNSSNEYLADAGKHDLNRQEPPNVIIVLNTIDSVDFELKQLRQSAAEISQIIDEKVENSMFNYILVPPVVFDLEEPAKEPRGGPAVEPQWDPIKDLSIVFFTSLNCNTTSGMLDLLENNANNNVSYLNKQEFGKVLDVIKTLLEGTPLLCKDFEFQTNTNLNINSSTKNLIITVTGSNPQIKILDHKGITFEIKPVLILNKIQLVQVKNLTPGTMTIISNTLMAGSIRVVAIVETPVLPAKVIPNSHPDPTVLVAPTKIKTIEINGSIRIDCSVSYQDSSSVIHWTFNGNPMNATFVLNTKTIFIPNALRQHSGEYTCLLLDNGKKYFNSSIVQIEYPATLLGADRETVTVKYGSTFNLTCHAEGEPKPTFLWYFQKLGAKIRHILTDSTDIIEYTNTSKFSELQSTVNRWTIDSAKFRDAGKYSCEANNALGLAVKTIQLNVHGPPVLVGADENLLLSENEGSMAEIKCEIKAIPRANITWSFDFQPISRTNKTMAENGSLVFLVKPNDTGIYECIATNMFGSKLQSTSLFVNTLPKIKSPKNTTMTRASNSSLVLLCEAEGYPTPQISWTFEGMSNFNSKKHKVSNDGNLELLRVTVDDKGAYVCSASNEVGTTEKTFELIINDPPKITTKFPKHISKITGKPLKIKCSAVGIPRPTVNWMVGGEIASHTNVLEWAFDENPAGGFNYSCVAVNSAGTDELWTIIDVIYPPEFIGIENNGTKRFVKAHKSVQLTCPFKNFDYVTWFKDDFQNNPIFYPKLKIKRDILVLQEVSTNYGGHYMCVVENQAGRNSFSFYVEVQAPPVIQALQYSINDGQTGYNQTTVSISPQRQISIDCIATGYPTPTVAWFKDGYILHGNRLLVLSNVNRADEGTYTCSARNIEGQAFKRMSLRLLTKPDYRKGDLMKYISVSAGNYLTLDCSMLGYPTPTAKWFFNGFPFNINQNFITIQSVNKNHNGVYKCWGQNSQGSLIITYHVKVYDIPKIVIIRNNMTANIHNLTCRKDEQLPKFRHSNRATHTVCLGESVRLDCGLKSIWKTRITWYKDGNKISNGDRKKHIWSYGSQYFNIQNTNKIDEGLYMCEAANKAGKSKKYFRLILD